MLFDTLTDIGLLNVNINDLTASRNTSSYELGTLITNVFVNYVSEYNEFISHS